ncbi:uncharacterized protein F5891DRAFT_1188167 [Suillus fuscotomentosus]|uniref:Uncharacterized protein n=1 Tax=Suillus fuscotomentosus TaxID=1912939 RepID=A0AAD4E7G2_9AGAM|nr:uncharacterized protein F5891DRAFT_1188167 [Suillus fuscotomentosus]KAG1901041.1 hypothetical protein F5891DRAFT_1188167 [Suillus fuscotomentosus]
MQGFKKHEASCKKRNDIEKEREAFALEHEQDQRRARRQAACIGIRFPSTGPSQSLNNVPSTSEDEEPIIPPDPSFDFDALGNIDFEGAIDNDLLDVELEDNLSVW